MIKEISNINLINLINTNRDIQCVVLNSHKGKVGDVEFTNEVPSMYNCECCIRVNADNADYEHLKLCYLNVINLAKEKGITTIGCNFLGFGNFQLSIHDIWKIALISINGSETDINVYLAINETTNERLKSVHSDFQIPKDRQCFVSERSQREFLNHPDAELILGFVTLEDREKVKQRLKGLRPVTKQLSAAFEPYLKGTTIGKVATEVSPFMSKSSVYNILSYNNDYRVSKEHVVILSLALSLNLHEAKKVLDIAGFTLANRDEDVIYEYAFENRLDLYDVDILLQENGCRPFSKY